MLLQTNSYIVPKEKLEEHARLMRRFKQILLKLGCDQFEVYEQTAAGWTPGETGRCVQLMRFRDRKHQQHVQALERTDPAAQALIAEFCELLNIPYQQQQGFFAAGFYQSILHEQQPLLSGETPTKPAETAKIEGPLPEPGVF
jgi:hypothetical protein